MQTRHGDSLRSQTDVKSTSKVGSSDELIERIPITGTPFTIIRNEERYELVMGRFKLAPHPFNSEQEVLQYINTNEWYIVVQMIMAVFNDLIELGATLNKQPKTPTTEHTK